MKEIISIVLVIIGALVGAGFASGQEIYSFFYLYGINGLFGIIIMCILMTLLIYKILKIINIMNIDNYNDFLKYTSTLSKKSINIQDVEQMNSIEISNIKKRTHYRYNIENFLKTICK